MKSMKRSLQQFSLLDPKPLEPAASLCPRGWLSWLLKKHQESDRESGLTLIEALMAVLILALVIGTIAPPLVIAVSTRVRNREVEQSLQVSRQLAEQARISLYNWNGNPATVPAAVPDLAKASDYTGGSIPDPADLTKIKAPSDVCETAGVPSGTEACNSALDMKGVDFDKNGTIDFYVQTFRANECSTTSEIFAFDMGVRVYPYDVVRTNGTLVSGISNVDQGAAFSDRRKNNSPLSSAYTTLIRTEANLGLTGYNASCP